ncbi:MAG TPA: VOC family protein [Blastocatellia bacterium]|nr:VOC family protein [Blastocatellia bacterium]
MGQPVMQWQILAKNPDGLAQFYSNLFSWKVDVNNSLGYRTINTESVRGINGGIWPSPPDGHSMVSLYVEVENVSSFVERARGLGANIIMPPQMLPDGEEIAIILDPDGIPVGPFKPAQS